MNEVLLVIPTYCESETLPEVVSGVRKVFPQADILVVDDNSPDGTGEWAQTFAEDNPWLHVLHRPAKSGLASAYTMGLQWGIDRGYRFVGQMDADGSHQPSDIARLYQRINAPDRPAGVIGARWIPGGKVNDWSRIRQWVSRAGNWYIRLMLGGQARDVTAGFRLYDSAQLQSAGVLATIESRGYGYQMEMTTRLTGAGYAVVEVPTSFQERAAGESKMSANIAIEQLQQVTRWGLRRLIAAVR